MASSRDEKKIDLGAQHFILQSMNEHERKFFFIRKEFVPSLKATTVTPKFYARHDSHEGEIPEPAYIKAIEDRWARGPKERSLDPETENQRYGWDVKPLIPVNKADRLMHHYHQHTPITIVAAEILMATRNMPKDPPFTGTPFKL